MVEGKGREAGAEQIDRVLLQFSLLQPQWLEVPSSLQPLQGEQLNILPVPGRPHRTESPGDDPIELQEFL
jgi:hypothetical protein